MRIAGASTPARCSVTTERSLFRALLERCQDRSATRRRAALAHVQTLPVLVLGAISLVPIVVHQLFAGRDGANRLDVDPLPLVDRLAVGSAAVIDEPRVVAIDRGVDHRPLVDAEEERVMPAHSRVVVTAVGLVGRDALAGVLDDSGAFANLARRERPASLDLRLAKLEVLVRRLSLRAWRGGRGALRYRGLLHGALLHRALLHASRRGPVTRRSFL